VVHGITMLRALERSAASASERIVFLAPSAAAAYGSFNRVDVNADRHEALLRDVQRFRGGIYLKDGAIHQSQLTRDGRHITPEDSGSWHMVLLDDAKRVDGCALYLDHDPDVTVEELRVKSCPLATDATWRPTFMSALRQELAHAREEGLRYVEVGGWAVSEKSRRTAGSLALALAVYGFANRGAGALAMTTATFRHCSSKILKRLGGSRFEADGVTLPPYYDPRYRCLMELLRFDSRRPNPHYSSLIDQIGSTLHKVTVIASPARPRDLLIAPPAVHALAS
jgi:hypothetical protein